jgi:hypothetical protein
MIVAEGDLIVEQKTLNEAGLGEHLRLVVQGGEIRILSRATPDPEKALDELAGCLGKEPATEYDFQLN